MGQKSIFKKSGQLFHVTRVIVVAVAAALFSGAIYSLWIALHSDVFVVSRVEIRDLGVDPPVSPADILGLAMISEGKASIFDLNLMEAERRILKNTWIREVELRKELPGTVSIRVQFSEPRALVQQRDGSVLYVDERGRLFGPLNLKRKFDLPLLSGFEDDSRTRLPEAIRWIQAWEKEQDLLLSRISSLEWNEELGYRALVMYPLLSPPSTEPSTKAPKIALTRARSWVLLGSNLNLRAWSPRFQQLGKVLGYLGRQGIVAKRILAESHKKIVVKTDRGL